MHANLLMTTDRFTVCWHLKKYYTYCICVHVFPGPGWDMSIREMATAVIKLEILSAAPNSEVSIMEL